jgi:hypothetical protein
MLSCQTLTVLWIHHLGDVGQGIEMQSKYDTILSLSQLSHMARSFTDFYNQQPEAG